MFFFAPPALIEELIIYGTPPCSQSQRERTSQAMETALAKVDKAERAARAETVKHQLRDNDDQARVWA